MKASILFVLAGLSGASPTGNVGQRATSEETTPVIGGVGENNPGAAGVRLSVPIVQPHRPQPRAMSEETPLSLDEELGGSGAAGVRVKVHNFHSRERRATSEELTTVLGDEVEGSGSAGLRLSIPIVQPPLVERNPTGKPRRATSDEIDLSLEPELSTSGSAGVHVNVQDVHASTRKDRRATSDESTLILGDEVKGSKGSAGLRLSFTSVQLPAEEIKALSKRAGSSASFVTEATQMFMVNVTVGTPPQPLSLRLSTGASDTWVPDVSQCRSSSSSSSSISRNCVGGVFNKLNSTSFTRTSSSFSATYASGDAPTASGDRFTDTFTFGTFSIPKAELGLVDDSRSTSYVGVLGIGHNRSTSTSYASIPDALVSAGAIKSKAYSFWFSDASAKSGNIVFGAVDKAKFTGELIRVPAQTSSGSSMVVVSDVIAPGGNNLSRYESPFRVTINPTDIISEFPTSLVTAIYNAANVTNDSSEGGLIPCSMNSSTEVIKIRLSNSADGPTWDATIGDLVLPEEVYRATLTASGSISTSSSSRVRNNGTAMCLFGVQSSSFSASSNTYGYSGGSSSSSSTYGNYKLGSGLLRRAYVVFDLHNREIAVAPTNFGQTTENIAEFAVFGATAPGAKLSCPDYSYSVSISSGYCSSSNSGTGSGGGGLDAWDQQNSGRSSFRGGLAIGIGVLIGVVGIALICFLVWFLTKRGVGPFRSKEDKDAALGEPTLEKGKGAEYYSGGPPPAPMMMSGADAGPATTTTAPSLAPIQETGPLNGVSPVSHTAEPVVPGARGHESVTPPSVEAQPATHAHLAEPSAPPPPVPAEAEASSSSWRRPHVPHVPVEAEASSSSHPSALTPGRAV